MNFLVGGDGHRGSVIQEVLAGHHYHVFGLDATENLHILIVGWARPWTSAAFVMLRRRATW